MVACLDTNLSPKIQNKRDKIPRSMKPSIPEPRHRVAPKGISSGLSFRHLPAPSFEAIRKICEHYEAKCSGQYDSLSTRYVLQMGKEIRSQIDELQKRVKKKSCIHKFDDIFDDNRGKYWHDGYGLNEFSFSFESSDDEDDDFCNRNNIDHKHNNRKNVRGNEYKQSRMSPIQNTRVHTASLEREVKEYRDTIQELEETLKDYKENTKKDIIELTKRYNEKQQTDQENFQKLRQDEQTRHDGEMEKMKTEVIQIKNDARLVIDFIRRKANEALDEVKIQSEDEKRGLENSLKSLERCMKDHFSTHLHKVDDVMQRTLFYKEDYKGRTISVDEPINNNNKNTCSNNAEIPFVSSSKIQRSDTIGTNYSTFHKVDPCVAFTEGSSEKNVNSTMEYNKNDDKRSEETNSNYEKLKRRVIELEQWNDTLTVALRTGSQIGNTKCSNGQDFVSYSSHKGNDCNKHHVANTSSTTRDAGKNEGIEDILNRYDLNVNVVDLNTELPKPPSSRAKRCNNCWKS